MRSMHCEEENIQRLGSSPSNRSLERCMEILRAFRSGSELLGNGELTARTGLPAATVRSPGRAYLAAAPESRKEELFRIFRARWPGDWKVVERQILEASESVLSVGYCAASWQPEVVALAAPIQVPARPVLVLNFSLATQAPISEVAEQLGAPLIELSRSIVYGLLRTQTP